MSTISNSATSPPANTSPPLISTSDPRSLPSLITSPTSPPSGHPRPMSFASKQRLSQYSTGSIPSRSRPPSHIFPMLPSSLPYALVRDFAYPVMHPMHYGPPPVPSGPPSGWTTPASEHRRLSDPPAAWEQKMPWDSWTADGFNRGHDIPPIQFGDGPPYSEDEDLASPVVATRHRRNRSAGSTKTSGLANSQAYQSDRGYFVGAAGDGSERYYVSHESEANGPGGDLVTYPPGDPRHSSMYQLPHQSAQPHGAGYIASEDSSPTSSPGFQDEDQSRYSRDYQFTITSPDEEFHGKAVALFDFERENENELPLVEGQIIWVSYRHGQGWLVAEDPKTQESGLVPEEYVRLLRDIEGGMNSLAGPISGEGPASPTEVGTPTQIEHVLPSPQPPASGNGTNGYHQPVVSMFSTSSKDLNPYPTQGLQAGQAPPQVVHYHGQRGGSQVNTPTLTQHQEGDIIRRGSQDTNSKGEPDATASQTSTTVKSGET